MVPPFYLKYVLLLEMSGLIDLFMKPKWFLCCVYVMTNITFTTCLLRLVIFQLFLLDNFLHTRYNSPQVRDHLTIVTESTIGLYWHCLEYYWAPNHQYFRPEIWAFWDLVDYLH